MAKKINRREYERQGLQSAVRISRLGSDEYRDARLINLGEGGLCVESCSPIRTGTVLYVQILDVRPDEPGLAAHKGVHGRVKWNKDLGDHETTRYGIGLEYVRPVSN